MSRCRDGCDSLHGEGLMGLEGLQLVVLHTQLTPNDLLVSPRSERERLGGVIPRQIGREGRRKGWYLRQRSPERLHMKTFSLSDAGQNGKAGNSQCQLRSKS